MKRAAVLLATASMVSACASSPDNISASYISPAQYGTYDCAAVQQELVRVGARVNEVAGVQRRKAKNDQVAMGVGLVLFWPALFFLASGDKKEELGRLKGEHDALQQAAIQKGCVKAPA